MKGMLIVLLLGLNAGVTVNGQQKSDRERDRLVGSVKIVVVEESKIFYASGHLTEGPRSHWRTSTYDLDGKKIKEHPKPHSCGTGVFFEGRVELFTDDDNRTRTEVTYDESNKPVSKHVWTYNEQGQLIDWSIYKGQLIDWSIINSALTGELMLEGRWLYTYDEKGNNIKVLRLDHAGRMERGELYAYDERNNPIECAFLEADGSVRDKISYSYEYDSQGNWVKETTSVWVVRDDKSVFEPAEVTYRTITYH
jgi:hypothetical protein